MEPLKWWLFNCGIEVSDEIATTLDMSHAFTGIEIKGDSSTLFLNRLPSIDLRTKFSRFIFCKHSNSPLVLNYSKYPQIIIVYNTKRFCIINLGDPSWNCRLLGYDIRQIKQLHKLL